MPVRRSLQAPDPDGCYLTKGHNVTRKIEQAIKKDDHGELRFLNREIELLCKLEGKLLRGVNLSRREREFIKALRGGLHDE
ncbi:hypothetical protein FOQG_17145 [Fusarium oxysporum f. sp. raphani 54005]|uniref:Uncharacterized protein n=1 Tax=Fusarium oxysporum f. sp. raphani 54005 TaxID=1089458 RepID=X0BIB5_FUSOX|nr:hypothetical protein FOQG_17145 [Fusarium oxysporum f. sp. raphani 54005]